jgi:hypothetical protein
MITRLLAFLPALVVVCCASSSLAQDNDRYLPYRGHLDQDGAPVTGDVEIAFQLYNAASGGTLLQTSTHTVAVANGVFAVDVGPLAATTFDSPALYLQLVVEGVPLATRQLVRAVPYAVRGEVGRVFKAERVEFPATTTDKLTLWSDGGASTSYGVGIGASQMRAFVPGNARFTVGTGSGATFVDGVTLRPNGNIESPRFKATEVIYDTDLTGGSTSNTFTTAGGTLLVFVSASGWSSSSGDISFAINMDGNEVGELRTTTNETGSHKAFVSRTLVVPSIAAGQHTLQIAARAGTNADLNDVASATVVELPY